MRKQLLVGVITGLAAFTLAGMGHETAQAATLPADYQGDWVAYVGKDEASSRQLLLYGAANAC